LKHNNKKQKGISKMSSENNIYFECICNGPEHFIKFSFFNEDDGELFLTTFLKQDHKWYKRIWVALKYIFGYKCKHGHFNEIIINPKDRVVFYNLAKKFKEFHDQKSIS
jgi:hypothetical protein